MYLENWCGIDSCAPKANILEAKLQIRSTPLTFWIGFWTIFPLKFKANYTFILNHFSCIMNPSNL